MSETANPVETPSPGPAKEGIVLDRDDRPVGGGAFDFGQPGAMRVQVRAFGGSWIWPLALVGAPLLLTLGLVLFAVAAVALVAFLALRLLFWSGPSRGARRA